MKLLGKLKRVDLREYWKHEALDFTRWLAEPENIEMLGDEVGIGLQVLQTEASVGRFNVDILAEEENTGRKIIIENQLETTDHCHLGQLITYAAGLEAQYIVWIVREVREEHRQAVDWLNEHTDEEINFFLIAIELWQIEDSPPAPKFTTISRPNEWTKSIRTRPQSGDLTDTKIKQLEFWQQLKEYAAIKQPELKLSTPHPRHWYTVSVGRSDFIVSLTMYTRENKVGCEIYIKDDKELFNEFLSCKSEIEKELSLTEYLDWQELPAKKASRIIAFSDFSIDNTEIWPSAFEWLISTANKFKKVFTKEWNCSQQSHPADPE